MDTIGARWKRYLRLPVKRALTFQVCPCIIRERRWLKFLGDKKPK